MLSQYPTRQRVKTEAFFDSNKAKDLYQPLKNALRKSQVPQGMQSSRIDNYMYTSKVSRSNKSFTSSEVQKIKAGLIFSNKNLVPTKNMEKVAGKIFKTVDVEERIGHPLSAHEIWRAKAGGIVEIVYEIQEEDEMNKVYTYTTTTAMNSQHNKESYQSHANKQQYHPKTKNNGHSTRAFSNKIQVNNPESQRLITKNPSTTFKTLKDMAQNPAYPSFNNNTDYQQPETRKHNKLSYSYNQANQEIIIEPQQARPYTFQKQRMQMRVSSPQRYQKKFNLFNFFDECGNNGCRTGCWKGNEVCAPKISAHSWI